MLHTSPLALIVILVIMVLLFGSGRVAGLGKELGSSIREFKKGLEGDAPTTPTAASIDKTKTELPPNTPVV